jgi:Mitochondrial K+-H+ exchange-related
MPIDVYLIPVADNRYELYCEPAADAATVNAEAPAGSGRLAAMLHRFKAAVARVEQEQQSATPPSPLSPLSPLSIDEPRSWRERLQRRVLCWVAEKVAEQRLLWRLRTESDVRLLFPDDLTDEQALATARAMLAREARRHLKWTIIDGVLFCASGILALLPGPNALAYYFGFRLTGHYLSRRGATHALDEATWQCEAAPPLTLLRQAIPLRAADRRQHVHGVASALHLQHLPTFFERTAVPAA